MAASVRDAIDSPGQVVVTHKAFHLASPVYTLHGTVWLGSITSPSTV